VLSIVALLVSLKAPVNVYTEKRMNIKIAVMIALASSMTVLAGFALKDADKNFIAANSGQSKIAQPEIAQPEIIQPGTAQGASNNMNRLNTHKTNSDRKTAVAKKQTISDALKLRYNAVSDNPQYPTIEDRIAALENMYPEQTIDPENVIDILSQPNAWKESENDGKGLHLSETELKDGRNFIEFDRERVAVMLPGDKIELPIKEMGGAVKVVIDSIKDEGDKTFTWNGHLEGAKEFMRVTITQGEGISVGAIETEKGNYALQSNDNKGWIASTDILMKHHPRDGLLDGHDHSPTDHNHE
jgi:hypothetical protein